MLRFTIDDLGIGLEYEFIKKDLRDIVFFIEINYKKSGILYNIGYFKRDKIFMEHWVDIIEENIDKFEYDEEELDLYIDFLSEFEDKCVEKSYEFDELIHDKLEDIKDEIE